jgi:hypothetical protein
MRYLPFFLLTAVLLGPACGTVPPVTADGLALKRVVIYRNGVGYFERSGRVESDAVVEHPSAAREGARRGRETQPRAGHSDPEHGGNPRQPQGHCKGKAASA